METITERIVTIARFHNTRALLLQSRLQSEGIDCFLSHQNLLQAAISSGVELKVRESDISKALELIDEYRQEKGAQKEKSLKTIRSVRRILVPVDYSDASDKAVKFAVGLARQLKAELKLFHVYYNPVVDMAPFDTSHSYQINLANYLHEIEQNARKQMASLVSQTREQASKSKHRVKVSFSLANGIAEDEIFSMCRKYKPGLLIMGSQGMGKQSGGLIGSVTAKVISKTTVPVIAIPEKTAISSVDKIKNVLYATDFDNYDEVAISRLINLLHPFDTTLHFVHVSIGVVKSWDKTKMASLKKFIQKEFENFPVKYKILVSDNVINGLETYMRDNAIEALALTNHARGLLNSLFTHSITKEIMKRINRPLLVFKAIGNL